MCPRRRRNLTLTEIEPTGESVLVDPRGERATVVTPLAAEVWLLCDGTRAWRPSAPRSPPTSAPPWTARGSTRMCARCSARSRARACSSPGDERTHVVAGWRVRCRSPLAGCLAALDHLCLGHGGATAVDEVVYDLGPTGDGRLAVVRDRFKVAVTEHAENLVALLQLDLRVVLEPAPEVRGFWPHAAGLERPGGGGLVIAGAPEAGKCTSALSLCRRGFRLAADDLVWLEPARGFRGLGWAIGLDRLPVTPATLEAEGFVLGRQGWRAEGGERLERFRIRPPRGVIADPTAWQPLAGIAIIARGPAALEPLTPGELLVRLWPLRIARVDGAEPWTPAALASALGDVPAVVLRSESPEAAAAALARWAEGLPLPAGCDP